MVCFLCGTKKKIKCLKKISEETNRLTIWLKLIKSLYKLANCEPMLTINRINANSIHLCKDCSIKLKQYEELVNKIRKTQDILLASNILRNKLKTIRHENKLGKQNFQKHNSKKLSSTSNKNDQDEKLINKHLEKSDDNNYYNDRIKSSDIISSDATVLQARKMKILKNVSLNEDLHKTRNMWMPPQQSDISITKRKVLKINMPSHTNLVQNKKIRTVDYRNDITTDIYNDNGICNAKSVHTDESKEIINNVNNNNDNNNQSLRNYINTNSYLENIPTCSKNNDNQAIIPINNCTSAMFLNSLERNSILTVNSSIKDCVKTNNITIHSIENFVQMPTIHKLRSSMRLSYSEQISALKKTSRMNHNRKHEKQVQFTTLDRQTSCYSPTLSSVSDPDPDGLDRSLIQTFETISTDDNSEDEHSDVLSDSSTIEASLWEDVLDNVLNNKTIIHRIKTDKDDSNFHKYL